MASTILVVAETQQDQLSSITAELLGAARYIASQLGGTVAVALLGCNVADLAPSLGALGADRVLVADDVLLDAYQSETYAPVVARAARDTAADVVLIGQTFTGRELGPRLAFDLGSALVSDCVRLGIDSGRVVMTKPVYGGSAMADYVVETTPQVATLRAGVFEPATPEPGRTCEVERIPVNLEAGALRTNVVETIHADAAGGNNLKGARVIVSGGRGLEAAENWRHVEELAQALDAAVGATRAVTDAGWVPASLQVGLTGVMVNPDLYIAVGISGAVQHVAGITGAKNVVAINKDREANIFKIARYGVVGDWKQVLPAFTQKVKELRSVA